MAIKPAIETALVAGTSALTVTAAQLNGGTQILCSSVLLQADPENTVDILIGDATNQTIQLKPDRAITISIDDISKIYAKTVSGTANLNWLVVQ